LVFIFLNVVWEDSPQITRGSIIYIEIEDSNPSFFDKQSEIESFFSMVDNRVSSDARVVIKIPQNFDTQITYLNGYFVLRIIFEKIEKSYHQHHHDTHPVLTGKKSPDNQSNSDGERDDIPEGTSVFRILIVPLVQNVGIVFHMLGKISDNSLNNQPRESCESKTTQSHNNRISPLGLILLEGSKEYFIGSYDNKYNCNSSSNRHKEIYCTSNSFRNII
jgi:hypothetical protein